MRKGIWFLVVAGCASSASLPAGEAGGDGGPDGAVPPVQGDTGGAGGAGGLGGATHESADVRPVDSGPDGTPDLALPASGDLEWLGASDVHMHANGCGNNNTSVPDLISAMKRAKISIGNVLIWGGGDSLKLDWKKFLGQKDDPASEPNFIVHWDIEISSLAPDWFGHLVLMNLSDLNVVKNGMIGWPGRIYQLPNFKYVHDQQGILGFAHGGWWVEGQFAPPRVPGPVELPFDVALDRVDFLSDEWYAPGFFWLWYKMLDAGFQIPPAGGSDNGCVSDSKTVGNHHTVFGLEKGQPLSYANYINAIRKGRTIIRNNAALPDIIDLKVNGTVIGGEVLLPAGETAVQIEVKASSAMNQSVELIVNGVVQKSARLTSALALFKWPVTLTKSSWIAARTNNAHTGTVFALLGGCPVRNDAVSARRWKSYVDAWYLNNLQRFAGAADDVAAKVEEAKKVWERIAQEAEGKVKPVCKAVATAAP